MIRNNLELLTLENKESFQNINKSVRNFIQQNITYVRAKGLGLYETEILKKDLIGMSLEADLRNENISHTLGVDAKKFCDSILENSQKTKYESILYTIYQLSLSMLYFSLLQIPLYRLVPISVAYIFICFLFLGETFARTYLFPRFSLTSVWIKHTLSSIPFVFFLILTFVLVYNNIRVTTWFMVQWYWLVGFHLILFLGMRLIWNTHVKKVSNC